MSGDALRRLIHSRERGNGVGPPGGDDDDDEDVSAPSFGFLRGIRDRATMFEIRHRDGKITAFTYSWLDHAEYDPSCGITLHFGKSQVTLEGRNLNAEIRPHVTLFGSILRHKVPWVQEADEPASFSAAREDVVIERVVVQ